MNKSLVRLCRLLFRSSLSSPCIHESCSGSLCPPWSPVHCCSSRPCSLTSTNRRTVRGVSEMPLWRSSRCYWYQWHFHSCYYQFWSYCCWLLLNWLVEVRSRSDSFDVGRSDWRTWLTWSLHFWFQIDKIYMNLNKVKSV